MKVKIRIFKKRVFTFDKGYKPESTKDFFGETDNFDKESLVQLVNSFEQTVDVNDCHLVRSDGISWEGGTEPGGHYELELKETNKTIASIEIIDN